MNLNKVEKMAKNIENASLVNKNVFTTIATPVIMKIKKLKAQILKLKAKLKESKYVLKKDRKLSHNNKGNRRPPYKRLNYKPVDKKNLKCYNCRKKKHFKSEYQSKLKDYTDYKNIQFLETK